MLNVNNMELPNSCRICLKTCSKLISLHSTEEYEETPRQMLFNITGICLENEEDLCQEPKQICRNCVCELNLAYQFRRKALESHTFIENYYKDLSNDDKTEIRNQIDIINETERHSLVQESFSDTVDKIEIVEMNFTHDNQPSHVIENKKTVEGKKSTDKTLSKRRSKNKSNVNQCLRPLSKRVRKPKSPVEQPSSFICDICGNVFSKRSRLTEHRYRHSTDLKHACELCGERFLLREMLRKHMYKHVGEKPYKCNYCSRTFYYESVKKKHEDIHSGHKPFVCKICDKAFAYTHSLKKHELIHEDIKLYHCECCNKEFRLPHHLKQHEQTVLHRNAVNAPKNNELNKPQENI